MFLLEKVLVKIKLQDTNDWKVLCTCILMLYLKNRENLEY